MANFTMEISALLKHVIGAAANYSVYARPSQVTTVTLSFLLVKTLSLSNSGVLDIVVGVNMSWLDHRLAWDPSNYGNLRTSSVPSDQVWTPSLSLMNAASRDFMVTSDESIPLVVAYTGQCTVVIQKQLTASCAMSFQNFPFDSQQCELMFVTMVQVGANQPAINFMVDTTVPPVSLDLYLQTGEFMLKGATMNSSGMVADLCANQCSPSVRLRLEYERRSLYYLMNLIVPAFLLTIILPFAFIIPSDNAVRVSMTCSLMIALYVLQQNVAKMLPPTAVSSLCATGSMLSLLLGCLSAIGTILTATFRVKTCDIGPKCVHCLLRLRSLFVADAKVAPDQEAVSLPKPTDVVELVDTTGLQLHDCEPMDKSQMSYDYEMLLLMRKLTSQMDKQLLVVQANASQTKKLTGKALAQATMDTLVNAIIFVFLIVAALTMMFIFEFQVGQ